MSVVSPDIAITRLQARDTITKKPIWARISLEGFGSGIAMLICWVFLLRSHSIGSLAGWLLFFCSLSSYILSIFAAMKQTRWWFAITALAFVLLIFLSYITGGCTTDPCPL